MKQHQAFSSIINTLIVTLVATASTSFGANVPASVNPPGGIAINKAPLFVNIGWDDNTSAEGLVWAQAMFDGKKNADGTPFTSSFFFNSTSLHTDAPLVSEINSLSTKHEVGNHTYDHQEAIGYQFDPSAGPGSTYGWNNMTKFLRNEATQSEWSDILNKGVDTITHYTNVTSAKISGFRSPYLEFGTNLYPALAALGYRYDCSIETNSDGAGTWVWPYTLDNESPSHNDSWKTNSANLIDTTKDQTGADADYFFPINSTPGLWELPSYALLIPNDANSATYGIAPGLRDSIQDRIGWMTPTDIHITGFDYNLWSAAKLSKTEVLGILKYNLDLRVANNRVPFLFGAHSQYYVGNWASQNAPNATKEQMQEAIEEFITYAASKSEVRIVSLEKVVDWMENPTELGTTPVNTAPTQITPSASTISVDASIGTVLATLTTTDQAGDTHTYTLADGSDFEISENTIKVKNTLSLGEVTLKVTSTDQGGLSLTKDLVFTVKEAIVSAEYEEVINVATWEIGKDTIGSDGTVTSAENSVTAVLTLDQNDSTIVGPDTTIDWAWVSVSAYLDTTFDAVTHIEVTYTSDKAITIGLSNSSYGYEKELAGGTHTVKIAVSEFTFAWGSLDGSEEPLVMSDMESVSFSSVEEGATAVEITSLKLYGYPPILSPVTPNPLQRVQSATVAIQGVAHGQVQLTIPSADQYQISFYSVHGRLVKNNTVQLSQGVAQIALPSSIARGVVIMQIRSHTGAMSVHRLMIQ